MSWDGEAAGLTLANIRRTPSVEVEGNVSLPKVGSMEGGSLDTREQ